MDKVHKDYGVPYNRYDYNTFSDIDTSQEERSKLHIGDIYKNQAQCNDCLEIVRSKNLHDFVTCSCKGLSVDGGSWYLKRTGGLKTCKELSIFYNDRRV